MSEKILYYLGAGASAGRDITEHSQALPIARSRGKTETTPALVGLPSSLRTRADNLARDGMPGISFHEPSNAELLEDFRRLATEGEAYGNIDMYAKYLNNKGRKDELAKLKKTLSLYFAIEQIWYQRRDKRYRNWLIGVMDSQNFPKNIKMLSWNYDFQVQLAANDYRPEAVETDGGILYQTPTIQYFPNVVVGQEATDNDYSLIHLNGIAGLRKAHYELFQLEHRAHIYSPKFFGNHAALLKEYNDFANPWEDVFHFAWESGDFHNNLMSSVEEMIEGTTIMVVVGYSFPFFNRQVDKQVFKLLKANRTLKKIYFQDPVMDGKQLTAQFDLDYDTDIVWIRDVSDFHIPFEY